MAVESLSLSAAQLRESLELCQGVTDEAGALLEACGRNLRALDRAVEPMTGRTLALTRARDNIKKARDNIEEVLEHLDVSRKVQGVIQDGPHANLAAFLAALSKLEAAIEFLRGHKHMHTAADALAHTSALRDKAVGAASAELSAVLARHCAPPPALLALQRQRTASAGLSSKDVEQEDLSKVVVDMLPAAVLPKLRSLAGAMLRNGDKSCVKVYVEARRRVLQQCLEGQLAGVGQREDMPRLAWRQVEVKIPAWDATLRLLSRLVQEEARLCSAIFPPIEQPQVLQQATAPSGRLIVEVGDAILSARRLPDGSSLFGLLDMHDALAHALPMLRSAAASLGQHSRLDRGSPGMGGAPPPSPTPLPAAADLGALQARVVKEVQACFDQLQQVYGGKLGEGMPPDATVHPLCASTLATLKRMLSYDSALPVLFGEGGETSGRSSLLGRGGLHEEARLLERMSSSVTTILDSLLSSLEAKSKVAYRSRAQAALHMMNNVQFMASAAGGRELKAVGEAWLDAHKGLVEQYQQEYMEACWGPLVSLMQADLKQPAPTSAQLEKGARQAAKDKWTAANKILEGVLSQQGSWTVVDGNLRYALKDRISETVLPLYQEFVARYMGLPFTENRVKYIKVSASQLQTFIAHDLFERGGEAAGGASLSKPSVSGASSLFRPSALAS